MKMNITAFGIEPGTREKPKQNEINIAREILRGCKRTSSINPDYSSYKLKHIFERHVGGYLSNGAIISAAVAEGFIIYPKPPNCFINISSKSIKLLNNNK